MTTDPMMPYASDYAEWPDYAPDEILPGLWQGGTEHDEVVGCRAPAGHYDRRQPFDLVITLYADALPAAWGVEEVRYGFPDADLSGPAIDRVVAIARYAHRRWSEGARVLIRCQAGVNRSGLVMALTLMREGLTATEAISLIRSRRASAVLSNRAFVRWLITEAGGVVQGPSSRDGEAA